MGGLSQFLSTESPTWSRELWDGLIRAIEAELAPLKEQLDVERRVTEAILRRGLEVIEQQLAPIVAEGNEVLGGIETIRTDALAVLAVIAAKQELGIPVTDILTSAAARFTSDAEQQGHVDALGLKAPLASPALTGIPTAPTAAVGTDSGQIATMAALRQAIDALIAGAPGALNTLDELAAALGDDANLAATVTAALAARYTKAEIDAQSSAQGKSLALATTPKAARALISAVPVIAGLRHAVINLNPGFRISQENGSTLVQDLAYPADQWFALSTPTSGGGGAPLIDVAQRIDTALYPGLIKTLVLQPDSSRNGRLAQRIEGERVAALGYASGGATPFTAAALLYSPQGGTFTIAVNRPDDGASYCHPVVVPAGVVTFVTFEVPPPPANLAWAWENTSGMVVNIATRTGHAGATAAPAADAWDAALHYAAPGQTNTHAVLHVGAFVMVPGQVAITAADLPYLVRGPGEELPLCQRHWEAGEDTMNFGSVTNAAVYYKSLRYRVQKRVAPTPVLVATGYNGMSAAPDINTISSDGFMWKNTASLTAAGSAYTVISWKANARP